MCIVTDYKCGIASNVHERIGPGRARWECSDSWTTCKNCNRQTNDKTCSRRLDLFNRWHLIIIFIMFHFPLQPFH